MRLDFEKLKKETELNFEIAKRITRNKEEPIYLVGGRIRDFILNRKPKSSDYDFMGNFDINQIQKDFSQLVLGRWDEVSTIKLKIGSQIYDFTATTDIKSTLEDFDMTLSSICLNQKGKFYDYADALGSLKAKEVRMNDADRKITLDPSRILRVFRISSQLKFGIEQTTLESTVRNTHLLNDAEYTSELWKILSLDYDTRLDIMRNLNLYNIDQFIIYPPEDQENLQEFLDLEKRISTAPANKIQQLFVNQEAYLVGGFIRDTILDKPIKDCDFKLKMPLEDMISALETLGYNKTENLDLREFEYYVNQQTQSISIYLNNIDIDIGEMREQDIEELILNGDLNLNCGIYNVQTGKFENPSKISEIKCKELRFCDVTNAKSHPLIIVNALKQISRIPDIIVPTETKDTITFSIPSLITLIETHPNLSYKLNSIYNNLNSEQAYEYFKIVPGGTEFLNKHTPPMKKLLTSDPRYTSLLIEDLHYRDRIQILDLLSHSYGKEFDESKALPDSISSVVFNKVGTTIQTCCLIDGERVYSAAAKNGYDWIKIFNDLRRSNYNIWATVKSDNPKIQALCSVAGLKIETNDKILKKILESKYPKYRGKIETSIEKSMLVFRKIDKPDYQQVMLRS